MALWQLKSTKLKQLGPLTVDTFPRGEDSKCQFFGVNIAFISKERFAHGVLRRELGKSEKPV